MVEDKSEGPDYSRSAAKNHLDAFLNSRFLSVSQAQIVCRELLGVYRTASSCQCIAEMSATIDLPVLKMLFLGELHQPR